jgi:hypothetical protein
MSGGRARYRWRTLPRSLAGSIPAALLLLAASLTATTEAKPQGELFSFKFKIELLNLKKKYILYCIRVWPKTNVKSF